MPEARYIHACSDIPRACFKGLPETSQNSWCIIGTSLLPGIRRLYIGGRTQGWSISIQSVADCTMIGLASMEQSLLPLHFADSPGPDTCPSRSKVGLVSKASVATVLGSGNELLNFWHCAFSLDAKWLVPTEDWVVGRFLCWVPNRFGLWCFTTANLHRYFVPQECVMHEVWSIFPNTIPKDFGDAVEQIGACSSHLVYVCSAVVKLSVLSTMRRGSGGKCAFRNAWTANFARAS